ncbi:MAG TPA: hypothetical protein VJY33_22195 [Isosphaeraceae bacterium]|nr:hypothetical protein [Isosphaeraceae bacterium]
MSALPDPRVSVYPVPARHGTCRLQMQIGKTTYTLVPPHGPGTPAWVLKKQGRKPTRYTCRVTPQGWPACDCPDHQNRGMTCKHLGALRACGLLSFTDQPAPRRLSARKGTALLPTAAPASKREAVSA